MKINQVTLVARKEYKKNRIERAEIAEEMIKRFENLGFNHAVEDSSSPLSNTIIEMPLLRQAYRHYMEIVGLNITLSSVSKLTMDRQRYGDLILNTKAPVSFEGNLAAPFMCYRYRIPYLTCLLYVQYAGW